jgi:PIN domain nuclease of toxin-antitoxin system
VALGHGILLDTHAFIWLQGRILTAKADVLATLRTAAEEDNWFISSFMFYEVAYAVARKRLHLDRELKEWFRMAMSPPSPRIVEISPEISATTVLLPSSFHGDPGDRILAATAILHDLTLCTHDKALLRHGKQGLFSTLKVNEVLQKHTSE